jgi:hypothetical protein
MRAARADSTVATVVASDDECEANWGNGTTTTIRGQGRDRPRWGTDIDVDLDYIVNACENVTVQWTDNKPIYDQTSSGGSNGTSGYNPDSKVCLQIGVHAATASDLTFNTLMHSC